MAEQKKRPQSPFDFMYTSEEQKLLEVMGASLSPTKEGSAPLSLMTEVSLLNQHCTCREAKETVTAPVCQCDREP